MDKNEALRLALEALETLHDENMDYLTRNKLGGENNQCMVFAREAITAIKEALAQPEQPKVRTGDCLLVGVCASEGHKIAPQRTWVGLTDGDIAEIYNQKDWDIHTNWDYERAIEAKLKEKNT